MGRKLLYLDIETIPSQHPHARIDIAARITPPANYRKADTILAWETNEKPALVEEAFRRTGLDGSVGHVVSIGHAVDDGPVETWCYTNNREDFRNYPELLEKERDCLQAGFGCMVHDVGDSKPVIVGHFVEFDIRFLTQRAIVHGVVLPSWWPRDPKPWSQDILCTQAAWAGAKGHIGLDRLCLALGIDGKGTTSGADVYDIWLANDWSRLDDYNRGDVARVRDVAKRIMAAYGEAA